MCESVCVIRDGLFVWRRVCGVVAGRSVEKSEQERVSVMQRKCDCVVKLSSCGFAYTRVKLRITVAV